jgi:hypothetical protein
MTRRTRNAAFIGSHRARTPIVAGRGRLRPTQEKDKPGGRGMRRDFFPDRDEQIVPFTANMSQRLVADPGAYGIDPGTAAHFAELAEAYRVAYLASCDPALKSKILVIRKDEARDALEAEARRLNRIIQANDVTDVQKIQLGLSTRRGGGRNPAIQAPLTAPEIWAKSVNQRTVVLSVLARAGEVSTGKARPRGVIGAAVYGWAKSGAPPARLADWQMLGYAARPRFNATFGPEVTPGTRAYLAAHWLSTRLEVGPMSNVVETHIPGGNAPVFVPLGIVRRAA